MKKIIKYKSSFWKILLGMLGFSVCTACFKYGDIEAEYIMRGTVVSSDDKKVIPDVKVTLSRNNGIELERIITKEDGTFHFKGGYGIADIDTFYIKFIDIDGVENDEFQNKEVQVTFHPSDFRGGDGKWDMGVANKDLGKIELQPKIKN